MRDVAALAGVSLKTTSRVINDEGNVARDLAERVRVAASTLDYRPNLTARTLRSSNGRTRTIGLVLEDVANPYSAAVHRAVEEAARARGFAVLASSADEDPVRERDISLALVSRQVDGLIIVPTGDDQSYLANDQRAGLKLVFVDRPPQLLRADTVLSDHAQGARTAVEHLIAAGHRRIAFLGDLRTIATAAERYNGYCDAFSRAGIDISDDLVRFGLHSAEEAQTAVPVLLAEERPTALFTTQNLITIGAIRALRDLGALDEVALVGFDDLPLADMLQPPVTVVAQDPTAIGAKACQVLFERIDGDTQPSRTYVIETQLIVRNSCQVRDPHLAT